MVTDAKQRGILSILAVLGVFVFLMGGLFNGSLNFEQFSAASSPAERPEFDPEYLYARAFQLYESNDRTMSRDIARRVIVLKPDHKNAHKLLAAIAMRDEDFSAAVAECKRLIDIDPADMTGQLGMGSALRRMGDAKKAEEVYRSVLSSPYSNEKQREEAHLNLAEMAPTAVANGEQGTTIP